MEQWTSIVIFGVIAACIVMVPIILNIFNQPDDTPEISSYLEMTENDLKIPIPVSEGGAPTFQGQPSGIRDFGENSPSKRNAPEQMLGAPVRLNVVPQPKHGGKATRIREELRGNEKKVSPTNKEKLRQNALDKFKLLGKDDVVLFGESDDNVMDPAMFFPRKRDPSQQSSGSRNHLFSVGGEEETFSDRFIDQESDSNKGKKSVLEDTEDRQKENSQKENVFQYPRTSSLDEESENKVTGRIARGLFASLLKASEHAAEKQN